MTKHLNSLRVQNFRCFKDFTAEKLGDVNLIVGKNNSGKSTVLEALYLYCTKVSRQTLTELTLNRDESAIALPEDNNSDVSSPPFSNFFPNYLLDPEIKIVLGEKELSEHPQITIKYGFLYKKSEKIETTDTDGSETIITTIFTTNIDEIPENIPYENVIRVFENDTYFYQFDFRRRPIDEGKKIPVSYVPTGKCSLEELSEIWKDVQYDTDFKDKHIIPSLRLIEPKIENIGFEDKDSSKDDILIRNDPRSPTVISHMGIRRNRGEKISRLKLKDNKIPVPLKSMGDGMATILEVILKAYNAKDGILLIDEVENGLHFSVQKQVWQVLFELSRTLKMQIFATTHSWDAIEAFAQVAKENTDLEGVLMRMGRSARTSTKDNIIATIYDEDRLFEITQQEIEVR